MEGTSQPEKLDLRPDMTVEVLTLDNHVTFVGRVVDYTGGVLTVRDAKGDDLPPVLYNREFKVRCFQGSNTLVLNGQICGSSREIWKLDRLKNKFVQEKRNFFRQNINSEAMAECVQRSQEAPDVKRGMKAVSCRILDVSAGGLCLLSSREPFQVGDQLSISNMVIVPEESPFSFVCRVQRSTKDGPHTVCGCQFESLSPKEEDRLLRAIFAAQRKALKSQRGDF